MPNSPIDSISVIGLGYIGLPTAAMFAAKNIRVIGVDISSHAVETINQGRIHIIEPDLETMVHSAVKGGYLKATYKPEAADVFIIAVPTPFKDNHKPDLSFVRAAALSIAGVLKKGDTVILESTSPVGTTEQMCAWLAEARPDLKFPRPNGGEADVCVAYCPERVLPGKIVQELVSNDRIIGGLTSKCSQRAVRVYSSFVEGQLLVTSARTAEMAKLTENSFRDVNIAFANELSMICDKIGVDVGELIALANRHPRVKILEPGCGVGGHCIAVDPWFIVDQAPEESQIIRTAREVNDRKPYWVLSKIHEAIEKLKNAGRGESSITVAILGLAFKPNIDDLRESPALKIARVLAENSKCRLLIVEPHVHEMPKCIKRGTLVSLNQARSEADLLVKLVKHDAFSQIDGLISTQEPSRRPIHESNSGSHAATPERSLTGVID